jgi:hypothetical protein
MEVVEKVSMEAGYLYQQPFIVVLIRCKSKRTPILLLIEHILQLCLRRPLLQMYQILEIFLLKQKMNTCRSCDDVKNLGEIRLEIERDVVIVHVIDFQFSCSFLVFL